MKAPLWPLFLIATIGAVMFVLGVIWVTPSAVALGVSAFILVGVGLAIR